METEPTKSHQKTNSNARTQTPPLGGRGASLRIQQLREQSLNAVNRISAERALLMTEFYKNHVAFGDSIPVQRAKSLEYILSNKFIYINDMELIVGERGPAPKATPTYPEITVHSLQDLEILNSREKVWFRVDEETKKAFADTIIPFWTGRSNRDRMMEAMTEEWKDAYAAGIFTEFMEQRAPGHTVAGYKIFQKGMLDIMQDVDQSMAQLDFVNDPQAYDKKEELKAMKIAANALIIFANRHAEKLEELANSETDAVRKAELIKMAQVCRRVPAHAPQTFHEVLQHYWFVHLGVVTELNPWDSFNPGRLDQHLNPFYQKEITEGTLTKIGCSRITRIFLGEIQQPSFTSQNRCDSPGKQHIHRFLSDQSGRCKARWNGCSQRNVLHFARRN